MSPKIQILGCPLLDKLLADWADRFVEIYRNAGRRPRSDEHDETNNRQAPVGAGIGQGEHVI